MLINNWDVGCLYPAEPSESQEYLEVASPVGLLVSSLLGLCSYSIFLPPMWRDGAVSLVAVPVADRLLHASMPLSAIDSADLYSVRVACLEFRRRLREDGAWPKGVTETWAVQSSSLPLLGKGVVIKGVKL